MYAVIDNVEFLKPENCNVQDREHNLKMYKSDPVKNS